MVFADKVLYLEWSAIGGGRKAEHAIDTSIFEDGMCTVQTVDYHIEPA
jgi:hypothetical protein